MWNPMGTGIVLYCIIVILDFAKKIPQKSRISWFFSNQSQKYSVETKEGTSKANLVRKWYYCKVDKCEKGTMQT